MTRARLMNASERWFRLLQRLYPVDFRDDMGAAVVEAYLDRARDALNRGGVTRLAGLWFRALLDSLRNGPGERVRPAASWRRAGNWGRDMEFVTRRLARAPAFVVATVATLAIGLGMFAVVYTVVQKILIDPMPYKNADDLYFVWRDYGPITDLKRGALAGTDIAELQKENVVIEEAVGLQRFLGGIFLAARGQRPDGDRGDGDVAERVRGCSASRPRSAAVSRAPRSVPVVPVSSCWRTSSGAGSEPILRSSVLTCG